MDLADRTATMFLPLIEKRIMLPVDPARPPREFKEGKFMLFIGGGNASGKTVLSNTLFEQLEAEGFDSRYIAQFGSRIFDDILFHPMVRPLRVHIERHINEALGGVDSTRDVGFMKRCALRAFANARRHAMDVGAPVIVDYHMDDAAFVQDCVKEARAHGYECIMLTPHIDAQTIIPRLEQRKERTGRPYHLEKVLARHQQFAEHLDDYLRLFDLSIILDNTIHNTSPTIVAISHRGETTIFNEAAYENAHNKRHLNTHARNADELSRPALEGQGRVIATEPGSVGEGTEKDAGTGTQAPQSGHFVRMIEGDLSRVLRTGRQ